MCQQAKRLSCSTAAAHGWLCSRLGRSPNERTPIHRACRRRSKPGATSNDGPAPRAASSSSFSAGTSRPGAVLNIMGKRPLLAAISA